MIPFFLVIALVVTVDVAGLAAAWWSLQRPRTPAAQSSARVAAFIARHGVAPEDQLPARTVPPLPGSAHRA
ncbi:hypothetical protein GCM10027174_12020 [Salinifilum aidingensis]